MCLHRRVPWAAHPEHRTTAIDTDFPCDAQSSKRINTLGECADLAPTTNIEQHISLARMYRAAQRVRTYARRDLRT